MTDNRTNTNRPADAVWPQLQPQVQWVRVVPEQPVKADRPVALIVLWIMFGVFAVFTASLFSGNAGLGGVIYGPPILICTAIFLAAALAVDGLRRR